MRDNSEYVITIHTDEQIELLQKISECYLRERMGQFWDLAEDLAGAGSGYIYDREDPDHETKFYAFIHRRDEAKEIFNQAYKFSGASGQRNESMIRRGTSSWLYGTQDGLNGQNQSRMAHMMHFLLRGGAWNKSRPDVGRKLEIGN